MKPILLEGIEYKLTDYWVHADKDSSYKVDKAIDIICDFVDGRHALHNATFHVALETCAIKSRARFMRKYNEALRSNKKC